jgi:UDP-N-acetylglucosamine--N-acetylmuramyl-(pentapeptide) pyrophosphoryl-undecaprenol N-acetylglucosamine transferase
MSGGGTAGHVYPALTVAERLAEEHDDVEFVGTPDGLEARLVPEAGVPFTPLSAAGFDRARPWTLVTSTARVLISTAHALSLIRAMKPDVVVGFGGYVSIPVGLAAAISGTPLVLLEQNSVPGLANRFLSRWARAVGVTYAESIERLSHPERAVVVGNPVRRAVLNSTRDAGRFALGVGPDACVLLVFGGSRGARRINQTLVEASARLLELADLVVIHVTGRGEYESVRRELESAGGDAGGRWRLLEYYDDMGGAIAASDLVLARAGATSIAEMTVLGAPAVLVPYPFATDDHQTRNAATLVEHGAVRLIPDSELTGARLAQVLVPLLRDAQQRATMSAASRQLGRPDATERVVALCRGVATGEPS